MNLSTEPIIRSSKSSITNFISQSGHRFGKKTLKIWKSVFFIPYYLHSPPYYLILSVQQFLSIYLSFYVSMYLCIYQPIHLSHSLSLPLLIFFQSLYFFTCQVKVRVRVSRTLGDRVTGVAPYVLNLFLLTPYTQSNPKVYCVLKI